MFRFVPTLNVASRLAKWMTLATSYAIVVGMANRLLEMPAVAVGDEIAALFGFVLGLLIGFRTQTANDRWWEARKIWGQLVNDTRNLALKARAHVDVASDEHETLDRLLIAFPHALRLHLRGKDDIRSVVGFEDDNSRDPHPPGYIVGLIHQLLGRWNRNGNLVDSIWILDVHARALLDICGACERIRSTPLPASYRSLIRWSLVLYVLVSPWLVSLDAGWMGLAVLMTGMAFAFAMELTAESIEEPFGVEGDDLPLDRICDGIETFVRDLRTSRDNLSRTPDSRKEDSTGQ